MSTNFLNPQHWEEVQEQYSAIPGTEGIKLRQKFYKEYFLEFGDNVEIQPHCRFYKPERIAIEDAVKINEGAIVYGSGGVRIRTNTLIGPRIFLHSANHVIDKPHKAFFDSGYKYKRVIIGPNNLISANVSILPGTKTGMNCFIACGAVVSGKDYEDNSSLYGVPATPKQKQHGSNIAITPSPLIGIVIGKQDPISIEKIKILIGRIAMPQVVVLSSDESRPSSLLTTISFDSCEEVTDWKIGELTDHHYGVFQLPIANKVKTFENLKFRWAAGFDCADLHSDYQLKRSLYYLHSRCDKDQGTTAPRILYDLLGFLISVDNISTDIKPEWLCECITGITTQFRHFLSERSKDTPADGIIKLVFGRSRQPNYHPKITGSLSEYRQALDKLCLKPFIQTDLKTLWKQAPELFYFIADKEKDKALEIASAQPNLSAQHTCILGHLYLDTQQTCNAREIHQCLYDDYYDVQSGCFRTSKRLKSFCTSGFLNAFLIRIKNLDEPNFLNQFELFQNDEVRFTWSVAGRIESNDLLTIPDKKRISISLFENWSLVNSQNQKKGFQLYLNHSNYLPRSLYLELKLREILVRIIHQHNRPALQLNWLPHGKNFGIGLRYDVDRPFIVEQFERIHSIQREQLNGACAAWYFLEENFDEGRYKILARHLQEVGLHFATHDPHLPFDDNYGINFHSAPDSKYWEGSASLSYADQKEVSSIEFLCCQLGIPGTILFETKETMCLPIHFPLEGTTSDSNLNYFNKLRERFDELRELEGYVMIGSHQDLNQNILIELLENLNLDSAWKVSPSAAASRSAKIRTYGQIQMVVREASLCLVSRVGVENLSINVIYSDGDTENVRLQLNSNAPYPISEISETLARQLA